MAISVDTLPRKMAEPVILADCFYQVICRGFAKWLHLRRNLRPAPPQWLRMAPRRDAVSAAMVAPCVGDVLRVAETKKFSIQSVIFRCDGSWSRKKTRGALRKKYQAAIEPKNFSPLKN
jgi:hypothetical protein